MTSLNNMENKHIPPLLIDEISRLKKLAQLIESNLKSIYLDINIIETTLVNTNDNISPPILNFNLLVDSIYDKTLGLYFSASEQMEFFESVAILIDNITIAFKSMQISIKDQKFNVDMISRYHYKTINNTNRNMLFKKIKNLESITSRALVDCTELKSEIHFISNTPEVI